jgi:hypothetical protein
MEMEKKPEADPRTKNRQPWNLAAFIAFALEVLAAAKRKKNADEDVRPKPDQT